MSVADLPLAPDVLGVVADHLSFNHSVTPPGHVHALAAESLADPAVTVLTARRRGALLGVGALRRLDDEHAELKSMHTVAAARRQGVGATMVDGLLSLAAERGFRRVSLETGTMAAFAPARRLYRRCGFTVCPPFGSYTSNPWSVCMTISLGLDPAVGEA